MKKMAIKYKQLQFSVSVTFSAIVPEHFRYFDTQIAIWQQIQNSLYFPARLYTLRMLLHVREGNQLKFTDKEILQAVEWVRGWIDQEKVCKKYGLLSKSDIISASQFSKQVQLFEHPFSPARKDSTTDN